VFRILISTKAEVDMDSAADWWATNHSAKQAERWYNSIHHAIQTLSEIPERCPLAAENEFTDREIRNLLFGVSSKPTHRVIFYLDEQDVIVVRVIHTSRST